jgi:hypothetical protein
MAKSKASTQLAVVKGAKESTINTLPEDLKYSVCTSPPIYIYVYIYIYATYIGGHVAAAVLAPAIYIYICTYIYIGGHVAAAVLAPAHAGHTKAEPLLSGICRGRCRVWR